MFEGLLKSKFYSKCKEAIKLTKTRVGIVKKKRNAMQRYLTNDIVDLLKNGLDINAYGRADGLLVELNLSSCYEMVEQYCTQVSLQLSMLDKQRECPEDCREAIASLMFAAARFADLPELRDLRTVFSQRYGNSLDCFVNKEFIGKLKSAPPTKDMKLQLLQDVAVESGIEWNMKSLEQKLYNLPLSNKDWTRNNENRDEILGKSANDSLLKRANVDARCGHDSIGKQVDREMNREDHALSSRIDKPSNPVLSSHPKLEAVPERNISSIVTSRRSHDAPSFKDIPVDSIGLKQEEQGSETGDVPMKALDDKKASNYSSIPPPYIKSNGGQIRGSLDVASNHSCGEGLRHAESNGLEDDKSSDSHQNDTVAVSKPKPKSVRRRRSKLAPDEVDVGILERDKGTINSGKSEEDAEKGRAKIFSNNDGDGVDQEERMMDRLLMHYSRKGKEGKAEARAEQPPEEHVDNSNKPSSHRTRVGHPVRGTSLESLPLETRSPSETTRRHVRAASFQPEILNPNTHVHPKLPDYDEFVARLATLRAEVNGGEVSRRKSALK